MTASSTGNRHMLWTDWTQCLQGYFKPVPNITSYHHFKYSKANAGVVTVKVYATSEEEDVYIFEEMPSLKGHRPDAIVPTSLDPARQWYLYEQIRPSIQKPSKGHYLSITFSPQTQITKHTLNLVHYSVYSVLCHRPLTFGVNVVAMDFFLEIESIVSLHFCTVV